MKIDFLEVQPEKVEKIGDRLLKSRGLKALQPSQISELFDAFVNGEFEGKKIKSAKEPIAYDIYKLQLPNPDAGDERSNEHRVIYLLITAVKIVVLMAIYYKKEELAVSDDYIDGIIDGFLS